MSIEEHLRSGDNSLPASDRNPQDIARQRTARSRAALDTDHDGELTFAEAGEVLRQEFEQFESKDRDVKAQ